MASFVRIRLPVVSDREGLMAVKIDCSLGGLNHAANHLWLSPVQPFPNNPSSHLCPSLGPLQSAMACRRDAKRMKMDSGGIVLSRIARARRQDNDRIPSSYYKLDGGRVAAARYRRD